VPGEWVCGQLMSITPRLQPIFVATIVSAILGTGWHGLWHQQGLDQVLLNEVPSVAYPLTADFNSMLLYRGVDVSPKVAEPGRPLKLAHIWEVIAPPGQGWKILVRLRGRGQPEIIADHEAAQGRYPVSRWERGDIIRDEHEVILPANWTAPQIQIVVGVIKGPGKLPVVDGPRQSESQLLAATLNVEVAKQ